MERLLSAAFSASLIVLPRRPWERQVLMASTSKRRQTAFAGIAGPTFAGFVWFCIHPVVSNFQTVDVLVVPVVPNRQPRDWCAWWREWQRRTGFVAGLEWFICCESWLWECLWECHVTITKMRYQPPKPCECASEQWIPNSRWKTYWPDDAV